MAEIELTTEQQQHMERLTIALEQDAALRGRLQTDPRAVFGEYGLADLIPSDVQFDINLGNAEVTGYAMAHVDSHMDKPLHFDRTTHVDSGIALGATRIQIVPTLGTAR